MFKKYDFKSYEIIIVLITVLIFSAKGNAQTKNNKITSNTQNIKNPISKQNQILKAKKPQGQLLSSKKLPITTKELEKKLLFANTGLAKANKTVKELEEKLLAANTELEKVNKTFAKKEEEISKLSQDINILLDSLDGLDKDLIVQEDKSKKYQDLINCYRIALFTWYDMNSNKGLTEHDHLVINVELRRSLFSCPPM